MDSETFRALFHALCSATKQSPDDVLIEIPGIETTVAPAELDIVILDDWVTVGLVPVSPTIDFAIDVDCNIIVRSISPN